LRGSYRLANTHPPGYRIKFDGVEVGSISGRHHHVDNRYYWRWGVDVMPLMTTAGARTYQPVQIILPMATRRSSSIPMTRGG
jgi:hypothetical protein